MPGNYNELEKERSCVVTQNSLISRFAVVCLSVIIIKKESTMTKRIAILGALMVAAILLVTAACVPITAPSASEAQGAATAVPVEEAAAEAEAVAEVYTEMS
jgi:hypothetical protein